MIICVSELWWVLSIFVRFGSAVVLPQENSEMFTICTIDNKGLNNKVEQRRAVKDSDRLWPTGADGKVTIYYTIDEDIEGDDKTQVEKAIKIWKDSTCIQFEEKIGSVDTSYLKFFLGNSCSSKIGLGPKSRNDVELTWGCIQMGDVILHEIGHALGFYHEHMRSDRDKYVQIYLDNAYDLIEHNFEMVETNNYGIPYDYSSLMHYGNRDLSSRGGATIITMDPFMMPVIGNRKVLSFWDVKLANVAYNCIDRWQEACGLEDNPCLNDGYIGKTCECICRDGTSGGKCENVEMEYYEAIMQEMTPYSRTIYSPGTISTPGYPTPVPNSTAFIMKLVAPRNHRVELVFEDFHFPGKSRRVCSRSYIAVYVSEEMIQYRTECGETFQNGSTLLSKSNILLVEFFYQKDAVWPVENRYRGFLATVRHIPAGNETLYEGKREGNCHIAISSKLGRYFFKSGSSDSCSIELSTQVPRYLYIRVRELWLHDGDILKAGFDLLDFRTYRFQSRAEHRIVPTSHVTLQFRRAPQNKGIFNLEIYVESSDCHKILKLEQGDHGVLTLPLSYEPETICEWWLEAPENMKIQISVNETFYIGVDRIQLLCFEDYLVINRRGHRRYDRSNHVLCGRHWWSKSIKSVNNKLNVLFNGINGGSNIFQGYYSVV